VKLDIYRKFTNALAVSVIASVVWIGYEVCNFTIYIRNENCAFIEQCALLHLIQFAHFRFLMYP
jgi:hypothetical protein